MISACLVPEFSLIIYSISPSYRHFVFCGPLLGWIWSVGMPNAYTDVQGSEMGVRIGGWVERVEWVPVEVPKKKTLEGKREEQVFLVLLTNDHDP